MNALNRMHKMIGSYGNLARKGTPGSDTAARQAQDDLMLALESGLRLKFGLLKGGGIMSVFRRTARRLGGDMNQSEILVARAMLDPEVAVHLLDTPIKNQVKWNKQLAYLLAGAAGGRESGDEHDLAE